MIWTVKKGAYRAFQGVHESYRICFADSDP